VNKALSDEECKFKLIAVYSLYETKQLNCIEMARGTAHKNPLLPYGALASIQPLLRLLPSAIVPTIAACNTSHLTQNLQLDPLAASTSMTRKESLATS
jgi:hypothetical protein